MWIFVAETVSDLLSLVIIVFRNESAALTARILESQAIYLDDKMQTIAKRANFLTIQLTSLYVTVILAKSVYRRFLLTHKACVVPPR